MASITYTARREFEPTISVTRTDISVASADDSFNAATGLLGFENDTWILVSGFTNAVNNGWFQVNGNSTATKISQDTTTALVTEAAGASITIKGYKRGLDQQYSMDFLLDRADRSVEVLKETKRALGGGASETLVQRRDVFIDVATNLILEANIKQWREFLASVEGEETFTLDRYGTNAVPVEPLQVVLVNSDYQEARDSNLMRYRLAFKVRVAN